MAWQKYKLNLGISRPLADVDVLKEDTVHGRLDFHARLVGLYGKLMLYGSTDRSHCRHQKGSERVCSSHICVFRFLLQRYE